MPEVLRICELVEGTPLGIELAAAWVKLMPVGEITTEIEGNLDFLESPLRNVSERQKSIRAVFEHSWSLLSTREHEVLRKLSVFRGGFRREAGSEVASGSIPVLASLTDKSLLRVLPSGRYDRHPLVFQYTLEKLSEHPSEEAGVRERHAGYFLALVEAGEPKYRTAEENAWMRQLDEEFDNIRAALGWMQGSGEVELGLRLASAVWWYWRVRGHVQEGIEWLQSGLTHPAGRGRTAARAKALTVAANLINRLGDFARSAPFSEESVGIWREMGDDSGMAMALLGQGNNMWRLGDLGAARALLEEAAERARAAGDMQNLPQILGNLAGPLRELGERDRVELLLEEALEIARATGNMYSLIRLLTHGLWLRAMEAGDYGQAQSHLEESLALRRDFMDKEAVPEVLWRWGELAYRMGNYPAARSRIKESLKLSRELGNMQGVSYALTVLGEVLLVQGDVGGARTLFEESYAVVQETGWEAGIAESLVKLGKICLVEGNWPEAQSLLTEGLAKAQTVSHREVTAQALLGLGHLACSEEDFAAATSRFEESLALTQDRDKRRVAMIHHGLGLAAAGEGDEASAYTHYFESLELHQALGDQHGIAEVLEGLANLAAADDPPRAARLWGAAEAIREAIGTPLVLEPLRRHERDIASLREAFSEDAFTAAWTAGRELSLPEAFSFAREGSPADPT